MATWKERYKNLATKGGHHARKIGTNLKQDAKNAAGGAGAYFLLAKVAPHLPAAITGKWYGLPLVMAAGGHFAKRKDHDIGSGIIGAAAAMAFQAYEALPSTQNANAQGDAGAMQTPGARGFEDAGAFNPVAEAPQLGSPVAGYGDAGEYVAHEAMGLEG